MIEIIENTVWGFIGLSAVISFVGFTLFIAGVLT